ncbi:MAG: PEP-CTERM sorting domain-containing protein, partial [Alphaproteobacteria bacterium]|nr:PEP-CTERM sorting domain-containing protein [Alphaproteobacteria bacterium]
GSTAGPLSFTVGGGTGTLTGYQYTPNTTYASANLYQKNTGADEAGIGIAADLDNEISNTQRCFYSYCTNGAPFGVVVIDLGAAGSVLRTDAANGTLKLSFNSVTGEDAGGVYYETTGSGVNLTAQTAALTVGTAQDNDLNPLTVHTTDEFLYITTDLNGTQQYSILLHDIEAPSAVPEPTTLALFGLGLAGLGFARRRKA